MPAGTPQGSAQQGAAQAGSGPRQESCKFMGILALSNINVFDPRDLAGQLVARFPAYRGPTFDHVERPEEEAGPRESYWFRAGDVTAKISLIPAPILPTVLEAAVRTARDWPDAARYLSGHRAQAVVELFSPAGATIAGRVDAACMTLMLCAALADLTPAMGVYWKSGGTITEPDRFRQRRETLLDGDLPFDIMVQINRLRNAPFISTTGLRDLLGREMEFSAVGAPDSEVMERAYTACRQLVAHGDSLRDGEPIPFEGEAAIVPKALLEGAREDIPVWSLTFVERCADSVAADSEILARPFAGDAAPVPDAAPNGNAAPRRPMQQMPRGRPGGDKCEPGSFTAFLALEQPAAVGEAELIERMRTLFPQLQSRIETGTKQGESRAAGDPIVFSMGGRMMMIMFLDQPMPPGTMTVAARASRTWPDAEQQLAAHRANVIVHAGANTKDWNGALDSAQNVSVVSATLADMLPTIGIYWSEGWVVTKAGAFIQATEQVLARKYSGAAWFQFWFLDGPPTEGGEPTTAVLTTGLEPFFGWEIEFLPTALSPATTGQRLLGLIEYLLTNGPVLKDGDTMGVSYEEAIRIRFAKQGQRPGIPVVQLTLEKIDEMAAPFQGKQGGKPPAAGRDGAPQTGRGETGAGDNLGKFTTYIPLKQVAVADEDRFGEALKTRFPDLHAMLASGWRKVDISAFGERFAFDQDGHEVGIMFVSGPSRPDMVAPALRAGDAWPESEAELMGHQGCLVVHVEPLDDSWTGALNCARIVTAVSAVLAEIYPAIGVTWSEADTFTRADRFVEAAPMILTGKYAKAAWIRRWTSMDSSSSPGQRTVAMGTVGLAAFIGREIEFVPARVDPGIIVKRLLGAVQYVLTRGPVLKHGGALKVSETERLRIHLADEGVTPGEPVYRLKLEMAEDNAPTADNGPATAVSKGKDEEKRPRFGRRVIN